MTCGARAQAVSRVRIPSSANGISSHPNHLPFQGQVERCLLNEESEGSQACLPIPRIIRPRAPLRDSPAVARS
jgi:hypothetical protein